MEIKDRIAAFEAKDFAKAFEGIAKIDLSAKIASLDPDDAEEGLETLSSYAFSPEMQDSGNDFASCIAAILKDSDCKAFIEPKEANKIRAIWVFNSEGLKEFQAF